MLRSVLAAPAGPRQRPGRCAPLLPPRRPASVGTRGRGRTRASAAANSSETADVVVVGGGIVGLFVAHELLKQRLSVTLLERKGLCAGATGAGQGYLWLAHRSPGTPGWALAARSIALWRRMLDGDDSLRSAVEWQECGSLLVAATAAEASALAERQFELQAVGLRASFLDGRRLLDAEPALALSPGGGGGGSSGGLLVTADTQINGRAAAQALFERCSSHAGFAAVMGPEAEVQGVELSSGAGAAAAAPADAPAAAPPPAADAVDITFTATTSASGTLLIGSSREFSGWDATPSPPIVAAILDRSAAFLPALRPAAKAAAAEVQAAAAARYRSGGGGGGGGDSVPFGSSAALQGLSVRVGLRPYAVGGLPLIGPVEGAPGLFVAAGHEGSGLCMGPATGELLTRHIRKHIGASAPPAAAGAGAPAPGSGRGGPSLDTQSFNDLLPSARLKAAQAAGV